MTLDHFFQLLEIELHENKDVAKYHRFANNKDLYHFRKAYLFQRYQFLLNSITKPASSILDLGCGYGTTAILLTLLGHKVHAITLEYYFDEISSRLKYWSQFGDLSSLTFEYRDFFDYSDSDHRFDYIIAIDTLHHIEPIEQCATVLGHLLTDGGKVIVCEENGNNIFTRYKHFRERGFRRVSEYFDERLGKKILFGNENTRPLHQWRSIFKNSELFLEQDSISYIRFFYPAYHNKYSYDEIIQKESLLWKKYPLLKEYFFFGINFILMKKG